MDCSQPGSSVHGIPGKNTVVGCHFLFQGIFPTQISNPSLLQLLHWQADSLLLYYLGSPEYLTVIHYWGSMNGKYQAIGCQTWPHSLLWSTEDWRCFFLKWCLGSSQEQMNQNLQKWRFSWPWAWYCTAYLKLQRVCRLSKDLTTMQFWLSESGCAWGFAFLDTNSSGLRATLWIQKCRKFPGF